MKLEQIENKIAVLQRKRDKAAGLLEALLEQIKEEFGCETLEDAEVLLEKMKDRSVALEETARRLHKEFEADWGELLNEHA